MMPSQSIGFSPEHQAFPGTLSLSANVLLSLVTDLGQQIAGVQIKGRTKETASKGVQKEIEELKQKIKWEDKELKEAKK